MLPTVDKNLVNELQFKSEVFLFQCQDYDALMNQCAQLVFIADLLLAVPELSSEAHYLDNLIRAYQRKGEKLDYDFEY